MKIVVAYLMLIFGLGINYIFNISVARLLGPASFGDYSYALYLFNIFAMIAISSLDMAALRFIPQTTNPKDIRVAIQLLSILLGIVFSFVFIFVVFMFVDGSRANIAYLFVPSVIPFVLLTVNVSILQAEHIVGPRMAFRYVIEPLTKIGMFFLLFMFFPASVSPAIALFIALVVTNITAFSIYWSRLSCLELHYLKAKFSTLFKFIAPMFISGTVSVLSGRLDLLILGVLVTASDLGHYSAAFQTAGMILIVLQGIETVYAPIFSNHIGSKNFTALGQDYQRALRWTMLVSSPLLMFFILYPEMVMLPFGAEYKESAPILAVLCIGQFFLLSLGSANSILVLLGKTKIVLFISIVFVMLTTIFVGFGANYVGNMGAAIGVVFAIALTNAIRTYFVYRHTKCHPFSMHYLKIVVALSLTIIFGFFTKSYFGVIGIFIFILLLIAIISIFGIHNEEKKTLNSILSKLRLVKSIHK
jgi:O-antigen/teichoic acid export membrane protein